MPVGSQWAIKIGGLDQAYFMSLDQALNVAMDAARDTWQKNGISTAVRLQQPDGNWQSKRTFGDVEPSPPCLREPLKAAVVGSFLG